MKNWIRDITEKKKRTRNSFSPRFNAFKIRLRFASVSPLLKPLLRVSAVLGS